MLHRATRYIASAVPARSDALNFITGGKTTKKHNKSKIITIIVELRQARFGTWNGRVETWRERERVGFEF